MNFIKLSNKRRTHRINKFSFIVLLIYTSAIISSCFFIKINKNESDSNPLSVQIEHAEGSKLNFTLTNDGSKDLEFSSFDVPMRGHFKQYFKITNENGVEVPYIGKYVLLEQTRDMWKPIKSGESIDFSVELFGEYDFSSTPGKYTIEFISTVTVMDINITGTRGYEYMPSSLGRVQDVKSNEIESTIDITNSVDPDPETREYECASESVNFANSNKGLGQSMLNNSLNYLTKKGPDYKWQIMFGPKVNNRYSYTVDGVRKIKDSFNRGWTYHCDYNHPFAIAWAWPGRPYEVGLTQNFFNKDNKFAASILAHESSHWSEIIGTSDHAYYNDCYSLAWLNPDAAIRNADSYRQYIYDTSDYTGPGGGGGGGGGISNGYYAISAKHSGKFLDVSGVSQAYGAYIHQWDWWGGDNQKWYLQSLGNGYYRISAKHSGQCLDVVYISQSPGANLIQMSCHGGDNQVFQIVDAGGGYYNIKAKHSGQCLDVYYALYDNGANFIQYPCHGGDNQKFKLHAQ